MTKSISTLISDIYSLVTTKGVINGEITKGLATDISLRLQSQWGEREPNPTLRLSKMGPRCPRALWYSIHRPDLEEALPAWAEIKYSFGHVLEALAIALAKASGHEVTGEQDAVVVDDVVGHRDCVIDGCIVDVKSSSSRGFSKFKSGLLKEDDPFGYLDQLDGYLVGSLGDPLVRDKEHAYILAIDKQLGHLALYEHTCRESSIRERIKSYKSIIGRDSPPECTCRSIPEGKSGNLRLDMQASYSLYKFACNPSIRIFLYSDGPKYFTKVERKPDVPEIDRHGRIVYN